MAQLSTPREFLLANAQQLDATWSGVRDGDTESIHDARVATRRIRAALPFVFDAPEAAAKQFRHIGRALGRVRELDATDALLTTLERNAPETTPAIAVLRRDLTDRLNRERRRMIKALDLHPRTITRAIERGGGVARLSSIWRSWRHELRAVLRRRAADVRGAIDRAPGVYMPNRSHSARIEIKKLRYTAELALAAGLMRSADVLDPLKNVQQRLGALHDLHVLGVAIEQGKFPDSASAASVALASVIAADSARIHRKYVRNRQRVRDACDTCVREVEAPTSDARALAAAAIVAVPVLAAWYLAGSTDEQSGQIADESGSVRSVTPEVA
jgi:CHAD domain-containing protein